MTNGCDVGGCKNPARYYHDADENGAISYTCTEHYLPECCKEII